MPARAAMKLVLVAVAVAATLAACSDDKGPASAPRLAGLQVLPATAGPVSIPLGVAVSFSAVGTYTDGTKRDVTGEVVWSSLELRPRSRRSRTPAGSAGVAAAAGDGASEHCGERPGDGRDSSRVDRGRSWPAEVVSLAVSPIGPTLLVGTTVQLEADAHAHATRRVADLDGERDVELVRSRRSRTVSESGRRDGDGRSGIATVTAATPSRWRDGLARTVEVTDAPGGALLRRA